MESSDAKLYPGIGESSGSIEKVSIDDPYLGTHLCERFVDTLVMYGSVENFCARLLEMRF